MRLTKPGKPKHKGRPKQKKETNQAVTQSIKALQRQYSSYKYREEYAHIAEEACASLGAGTDEIAKMFRVSTPTIYNWMKAYPQFYNSVKSGKDRFDSDKVENSILRRALGYDIEIREERLTKQGRVVPCRKTVHIPADVQAAEFWLCNRNKERWRSLNASRYQQLNVFPPQTGLPASGGNGKGEKQDADYNKKILNELQEVAFILRDSGALEALPESSGDEGSHSKAN